VIDESVIAHDHPAVLLMTIKDLGDATSDLFVSLLPLLRHVGVGKSAPQQPFSIQLLLVREARLFASAFEERAGVP
jgi:hypothetical protein